MTVAAVIDLATRRRDTEPRDTEPAPPPSRHPLVLSVAEGFVRLEFGSPPDVGPFVIGLAPDQAADLAHDLLRMARAAEAAR